MSGGTRNRQATLRVGHWEGGKLQQQGEICMDCKCTLVVGTLCWRPASTAFSRRLCDGCFKRRRSLAPKPRRKP